MRFIILFLFGFIVMTSYSQDIERITVNGRIVVYSKDKEGVTVYNTSSNNGTLTDENGEFELAVTLNDIVEFGALQFKDFKVTITNGILTSKRLTVILVEEVNKLDEVVILPFGLTGSLNADLENVRTYNVSLDYVYFGLNHIEDFEFSADYKTEADNLAFNESNPTVDNMLNIVNLAGFIVGQVVDMDTDGKETKLEKAIPKTRFQKALDKYSVNYIHVNFNIPLDQVEAFTDYIEEKGVDEELLQENKELQFLERLTQLSKSYLKEKSEKD